MSSPLPDGLRERRYALWLLAALVLLQCLAITQGGFRADDWINLERGRWAWSPAGARQLWTSLNPFTLYRPLVDLWHGLMLRLFGLEPTPMFAVLAALLLLQSWLVARLVRAHGGGRTVAALAMAAVWCQPNTYAWTTLWVSNATGSLMATFALLSLLAYARAVRQAARGRSMNVSLIAMAMAFVAGALCKEEIVLLPGIVIALEWPRWRTRDAATRRALLTAWLTLTVVTILYTIFRTHILPTPQSGESRYHLRMGMHVLNNLGFFATHLLALPLVTLVVARAWLPAAFRPEAANDERWGDAKAGILAGLGWSVAAMLLYLPISGRPAYGYLYIPAFGIAYATAHGLAFAAAAQAATGVRRFAVPALAVHALLATGLCAAALVGIGWDQYPELTHAAVTRLRREHPAPPPGARMVFLDCGSIHETFAGRTLFNLVFDDASGSFLRLVYKRDDLDAVILHGALPETLVTPAGTIAVYRTDYGRLAPWPASLSAPAR